MLYYLKSPPSIIIHLTTLSSGIPHQLPAAGRDPRHSATSLRLQPPHPLAAAAAEAALSRKHHRLGEAAASWDGTAAAARLRRQPGL